MRNPNSRTLRPDTPRRRKVTFGRVLLVALLVFGMAAAVIALSGLDGVLLVVLFRLVPGWPWW